LVPKLVDDAKQGKYKPDLLRKVILDGLTGGTLKSLVCTSCGAKFVVDKPPQRYTDYNCPVCGIGYSVRVDRDATELLRSALAAPQPLIVLLKRPPEAAPDKSSGPKQGPSQ